MIKLICGALMALGLVACQDDDNSAEKANVAKDQPLVAQSVVTSTQDVKKTDAVKVDLQKHLNKPSQDVLNEVAKLSEQPKQAATAVIEKSYKAVESSAIEQKPSSQVNQAKQQAAAAALAEQKAKLQVKQTVVLTAKKNAASEALKSKLNQAAKAPVLTSSLGDAIAGKKLAKRCSSCHNFTMKDKVGPHLQGVFNRAAGQSGFKKHSAALKAANWNWDESHLLKWVCDSKAAVKEFSGNAKAKTKMPNQKMCGKKAQNIVAYLKTI